MDSHIIADRRRENWITAVVALSVFMFSLDYSMMNISLPVISGYFRVNIAAVARLPLVYLLVVTGTMLGFGKLGDIQGYKKVFILGLSVFLSGLVLCSLSPNMHMLVASRAIQSLGEAMFSPTGIAILTSFLSSRIRGRALGIAATAQGLGFTIGAFCGGFLSTHFSWRAIFLLNIPFTLAAIILALKILPLKQVKNPDKRFDVVGAVLIFTALTSFVYGLNSLGKKGAGGLIIAGCFVISFAAFILFIFQIKRIEYPLLDPALFKNINFVLANAAALLTTSVLMGFLLLAPFYLEMVRKMTTLQAGLMLMIPSLAMMILSPVSGHLADRIGSRGLCSLGMALACASFGLFSCLDPASGMWLIISGLFLLGAAGGIFLAPNNKLIMAHAPENRQGWRPAFTRYV